MEDELFNVLEEIINEVSAGAWARAAASSLPKRKEATERAGREKNYYDHNVSHNLADYIKPDREKTKKGTPRKKFKEDDYDTDAYMNTLKNYSKLKDNEEKAKFRERHAELVDKLNIPKKASVSANKLTKAARGVVKEPSWKKDSGSDGRNRAIDIASVDPNLKRRNDKDLRAKETARAVEKRMDQKGTGKKEHISSVTAETKKAEALENNLRDRKSIEKAGTDHANAQIRQGLINKFRKGLGESEYTMKALDIMEEIINELHITDKALKKKMDNSWQAHKEAEKKVEKGYSNLDDLRSKDKEEAKKTGNWKKFEFARGNETDVEQERRIYPKETSEIAKNATESNRQLDRYHRARERYNQRNSNSPEKNRAKDYSPGWRVSQDTWYKNHGSNAKTNVYKKDSDHWGNHPDPSYKSEALDIMEEIINEVSVKKWKEAAKNSIEGRNQKANDASDSFGEVIYPFRGEVNDPGHKRGDKWGDAEHRLHRAKELAKNLPDSDKPANKVVKAAKNSVEGRNKANDEASKNLNKAANDYKAKKEHTEADRKELVKVQNKWVDTQKKEDTAHHILNKPVRRHERQADGSYKLKADKFAGLNAKEALDIMEELLNLSNSIFEVESAETEEVPPSTNKIKRTKKDKDTKKETEVVSVADELFPYEGNAKEQYNQKVLAKINDMIEGTGTLEDLMQFVRRGAKSQKAHESLEVENDSVTEALALMNSIMEELNIQIEEDLRSALETDFQNAASYILGYGKRRVAGGGDRIENKVVNKTTNVNRNGGSNGTGASNSLDVQIRKYKKDGGDITKRDYMTHLKKQGERYKKATAALDKVKNDKNFDPAKRALIQHTVKNAKSQMDNAAKRITEEEE